MTDLERTAGSAESVAELLRVVRRRPVRTRGGQRRRLRRPGHGGSVDELAVAAEACCRRRRTRPVRALGVRACRPRARTSSAGAARRRHRHGRCCFAARGRPQLTATRRRLRAGTPEHLPRGHASGTSTLQGHDPGTRPYIGVAPRDAARPPAGPAGRGLLGSGRPPRPPPRCSRRARGLVRDGKIGDEDLARTRGRWPATARPRRPTPVEPTAHPDPSGASAVRIREDVWTLSATANGWHPTLLWYARAACARSRPATRAGFATLAPGGTSPRSHGDRPDRPGNGPAGARWDSCEHGSWHFLPWHRVYLHHFERIMRDEIVAGSAAPRTWALPFWNYSDTSPPDVRSLPPAFRATTTCRTEPAEPALRVNQRGPNINAGSRIPRVGATPRRHVAETAFTLASSLAASAGGPATSARTGAAGRGSWRTTRTASSMSTSAASTPVGYMSASRPPAQDPIFWLHHANIDRLWEAWRAPRDEPNPTRPAGCADARSSSAAGSTTTSLHDRAGASTRGSRRSGYRYSDMPVSAERRRGARGAAGRSGRRSGSARTRVGRRSWSGPHPGPCARRPADDDAGRVSAPDRAGREGDDGGRRATAPVHGSTCGSRTSPAPGSTPSRGSRCTSTSRQAGEAARLPRPAGRGRVDVRCRSRPLSRTATHSGSGRRRHLRHHPDRPGAGDGRQRGTRRPCRRSFTPSPGRSGSVARG